LAGYDYLGSLRTSELIRNSNGSSEDRRCRSVEAEGERDDSSSIFVIQDPTILEDFGRMMNVGFLEKVILAVQLL